MGFQAKKLLIFSISDSIMEHAIRPEHSDPRRGWNSVMAFLCLFYEFFMIRLRFMTANGLKRGKLNSTVLSTFRRENVGIIERIWYQPEKLNMRIEIDDNGCHRHCPRHRCCYRAVRQNAKVLNSLSLFQFIDFLFDIILIHALLVRRKASLFIENTKYSYNSTTSMTI